MKEKIYDLLFSIRGFNCLSCYLDPNVWDDEEIIEDKELVQRLTAKENELAIRGILTAIYLVLGINPFPCKEMVSCFQRLVYDEEKKEWVDDDPELCRKWLEKIYKMIEEEAIKEGKLNLNYQEEKWFLIYKTPPEHFKNFLVSLSPELDECASEVMEKVVLEKFVAGCTNNGEIKEILREGYEMLAMDPPQNQWIEYVIHSSIEKDHWKKLNDPYLCLPEFCRRILETFEGEAIKHGKFEQNVTNQILKENMAQTLLLQNLVWKERTRSIYESFMKQNRLN